MAAGQFQAEAGLNETRTAAAIWKALPIEVEANLWGYEIYFAIPVKMALEKEQEVVQIVDLGYWPPGLLAFQLVNSPLLSFKSPILSPKTR